MNEKEEDVIEYSLTVKQALKEFGIDVRNKCCIHYDMFDLDNIELDKGIVLVVVPDGKNFIKQLDPFKKIAFLNIRNGQVERIERKKK